MIFFLFFIHANFRHFSIPNGQRCYDDHENPSRSLDHYNIITSLIHLFRNLGSLRIWIDPLNGG